jgi:cytochrome c oxidase subunit 2
MRRSGRRSVAAAAALVAGFIVFVEPVAAQSVNRDLFDGLNQQLLYVALPLTVFVEIILVYAVVRFRDNDDPKPTAEDPALEVTWTAATAIILLFVFVAAFTVLASPYMSTAGAAAATNDVDDAPGDAVEIRVLAYQYGWEFRYPGANVTTQDELVVPTDHDVYLNMTSADVIHSLFVPEWGVKQDVFPGRQTYIRTNVYERGEVRLYCTELCGSGHSRMTGDATAVSPATYETWLDENAGERNVRTAPTPTNATAT